MHISYQIPIRESSGVGEARRTITSFATSLAIPESIVGQISIIATELAGNLVKHTKEGGWLLYRALDENGDTGIEILSLDRGPGMQNISQCLEDGYSTAGSPGTGMGAIQRLASVFDISSVPGRGTAVLVQCFSQQPSRDIKARYQCGSVCLPIQGERVCGDSWALELKPMRADILITDGLGHGPNAHEASAVAVGKFQQSGRESPAELVKILHSSLKSTRGAAVAVAQIDEISSKVRYCGLGNTIGVIFELDGSAKRMVSLNGTAGLQFRTVQEFDYAWSASSVMVLATDGLKTHLHVDNYPGLLSRHASLIAGVIWRDFHRGTDDATVMVLKGAG